MNKERLNYNEALEMVNKYLTATHISSLYSFHMMVREDLKGEIFYRDETIDRDTLMMWLTRKTTENARETTYLKDNLLNTAISKDRNKVETEILKVIRKVFKILIPIAILGVLTMLFIHRLKGVDNSSLYWGLLIFILWVEICFARYLQKEEKALSERSKQIEIDEAT